LILLPSTFGIEFVAGKDMKHLILLLLLIISTVRSWAHTGSSVAGAVTLNGVLKSWIIKSKIPLGGLTAFYGYEALAYPKSTPVYCLSGSGLSTGNSLIGIKFGGQFNHIKTVGRCEKPKDYLGGFLSIGIDYALKGAKASQTLQLQSAINLGFDLETFNQKIYQYYTIHAHSNSNRSVKKRFRDVIWHLAKYAGRANAEKVGDNAYLLKFLLIPFLGSAVTEWRTALEALKLKQGELKKLQEKKLLANLKSDLSDVIYRIKRDPGFYVHKGGDAEEIFVDAYTLFDALEESLGECHSISVGVSPLSTFDLNLPVLNSNLGFSFSYTYYGLKQTLEAGKSTTGAASKAFAAHNLTRQSASCQNIEEKAAGEFGTFLALLGAGGKP
jgi:hypothetical protein